MHTSLITGSQHGFTKERATLSLTDGIVQGNGTAATGENLAIISLDFKKTFDIVAHKRLIF